MNSALFFIAAFITNVKLLLSVSCPSPFTPVGSGCYYILSESRIDWYTAYANCKLDLKGYLAEITDEQEQANIVAFIKRADPDYLFWYWLGGSDMQQEGYFRWMTSGNYVTYTAWGGTQPDNYGNSEDCLHVWVGNNVYVWNDYVCARNQALNHTMKGLCEADPLSTCIKPEIPCEQTYDKVTLQT